MPVTNQKDFGDFDKSMLRKIFEVEMLFRTQLTILFQIFWEFMINSKTIFKSIIVPDDSSQGDLQV